jgi:nucleoside-diphosphate-sugar epimerase
MSSIHTGSVLVAGCGLVGLPLARLFQSAGWKTLALTRSEESARRLAGELFTIAAIDITHAHSLEALGSLFFDVVIHCASSGKGAASAYENIYLRGTENLLNKVPGCHFVLAGSTSVYAQTDGSIVDESSETAPDRETGKILLQAERLVLSANGSISRLAGIYSRERSAPLRKLLNTEAVLEGDGERLMNMIHHEDAASAIFFIAQNDHRGIFNVTDNHPATQREWFESMCRRLNKPLPPTGPRDLARKRAWTNKRVSNKKIRSLGWEPRYPTFLDGLADLNQTKS